MATQTITLRWEVCEVHELTLTVDEFCEEFDVTLPATGPIATTVEKLARDRVDTLGAIESDESFQFTESRYLESVKVND